VTIPRIAFLGVSSYASSSCSAVAKINFSGRKSRHGEKIPERASRRSLIKFLAIKFFTIFDARFLESSCFLVFVPAPPFTVPCYKIHFLQAGNCVDDETNFVEFRRVAVFGISRMEPLKSEHRIGFDGF